MKRFLLVTAILASSNQAWGQNLPEIPTITNSPAQAPPEVAPAAKTPQEGPGKLPPMTNPMDTPAPVAMMEAFGPTETLCNDCNKGGKWTDRTGPKDPAWMRIEYGYYWLSRQNLPTLATNPTNQQSLFESRTGNTGGHVAGAITGGAWLNEKHTVGITFGGMMTEQLSAFQTATGTSINRPFFNALTVANDSLIVAQPGFAVGAMEIHSSARMSSAKAGFIWNVAYQSHWNINYLLGFRYNDLDEQLSLYSTSDFNRQASPVYTGAHPAAGLGPIQNVFITDRFRTRNQFYGAEMGADVEYCLGPVTFGAAPKVAFGPVRQSTGIDGSTRFTNFGGEQVTVPGGFLAAGAPNGAGGFNGILGNDTTTRMGLLVDLTGRVGVQLTAHARITAGYNFIYMTDIARPALAINPVINPSVLPVSTNYGTLSGPLAPRMTYDRGDYVAHGVTFGLEFRY